MSIDAIRALILTVPGLAGWNEVVRLIERPLRPAGIYTWDYCRVGCLAVGGRAEDAIPGEAAILCSLLSIHLVDDILDGDPRGRYHEIGEGPTANIALALQGAASCLLGQAPVGAESRAAMLAELGRMNVATAIGQDFDALDHPGEEAYWRSARAKTPPLFGCGLFVGALLGGASLAKARAISELGLPFGEMIQVGDDLSDAMEAPPCPDWRKRGGNLAILYARLAPHPEIEAFERLVARVDQPEALSAAQEILIRSGAVSYCAYSILQARQRAAHLLKSLDLPRPSPMEALIDRHVEPTMDLLRRVGIDCPENLLEAV